MKRVLVLFAKEFPYGGSEPFLESEYPLYREYFDKVLLMTNRPRQKKKTRQVEDSTVEILESRFDWDRRRRLAFLWAAFSDPHLYSELFRIVRHHRGNRTAVRQLISTVAKANLCAKLARKRCRQLEAEGYTVAGVYAYWLLYPAYAAVQFNRKYYGGKLYTLSRAHGFDLYHYRNAAGYLPCRKYLLSHLSEVACISDNGKAYLEKMFPRYPLNITVHRLGARDVGAARTVEKGETLRMVSCARIVPLKRLHRIADALAQMDGIAVEWTHCGGGDGLAALKAKAESLPENIRCIFTDTIPNTAVYDLYREKDFHVFVNVSESEGIPVSIMEAMSFGTPIVATDVGGTRETIDEGENGYLLPEDFTDEQLAEHLTRLAHMDGEIYSVMRRRSRQIFEERYNAIPNYHRFLRALRENTEKQGRR